MNSFYAVTGLVNAIVPLSLGFFVYFNNKASIIGRSFFLLTLSATVWGFGYSLWQLSDSETDALFWARILMAGAIFIPITYYHFAIAFLDLIHQRLHRFLLYLGYVFSTIFLLADFTRFFVAGVSQKLNFPFWPNPGFFFHFFLIFFFIFIFYGLILFFYFYRCAEGVRKRQLLYILIGTLIGFGGGSTNYFLWYNILIPPLGNTIAIAFIAFIAYAILKHHLFDIKVIAAEFFTAVLLFILLVNVFNYTDAQGFLLNFFIFLASSVFGVFLIRAVLWEVKTREELERLAADLSAANEQLTTLDRAKSEFIAIASHQLRTPLTAIKGYISLLMEGTYGALREKQKKPMNGVFQSAERLIRLVNDLLSISRIESGKIEAKLAPTDIKKLIEGVIEELRMKVEGKGLTLDLENSHGAMPVIMADEEKIRNVLMNIIDNAIRYTFKGGITVCLNLEEAERRIRIEIKDTGEGMTREEMSKLFESFSRGTAGQRIWTEGAGLGLYIAKKFIEMHKGRIWAESEGKGKGSEFVIELPL